MQIAVLGTGTVGRTLAAALSDLGHEVTVGTRNPTETLARAEPDETGGPPFAEWASDHGDVRVATFASAAAAAEMVVVATNGSATLAAVQAAGAENLADKVLVDVTNPLDFSQGFPPTLLVKDTDSLAEQLQRQAPQARVVKTLNTMNAHLMVDPASLGEDSSVFVSGDDADAKASVVALLESFGHRDVIDLGGLSTARGAEMLLPLWVRLMGALGTAAFNFKVVR